MSNTLNLIILFSFSTKKLNQFLLLYNKKLYLQLNIKILSLMLMLFSLFFEFGCKFNYHGIGVITVLSLLLDTNIGPCLSISRRHICCWIFTTIFHILPSICCRRSWEKWLHSCCKHIIYIYINLHYYLYNLAVYSFIIM